MVTLGKIIQNRFYDPLISQCLTKSSLIKSPTNQLRTFKLMQFVSLFLSLVFPPIQKSNTKMPALLCLPQNVPKLWIWIAAPITHTQRPSNVSQQNDDGQCLNSAEPRQWRDHVHLHVRVSLYLYIVPQPPPGNNYYWKHSFDLICQPTKRFSNYSNYAQNSICFHPHIHIRVPFWFDRCLPLTWIIIIIACVGVLRRILNHDCLMSLADTLYYSTTGPVFHSSPGGQWMTKLPLSLCNEYNNTIAWMSPRWWLLITGIVAPNEWMRLEIMCPPTNTSYPETIGTYNLNENYMNNCH